MSQCAEPVRLVPGSQGARGTDGSAGVNGIDGFTTLTAQATQPAVGGTVNMAVANSGWATIGQPVFVQFLGVLYVTAVPDATHITAQNPAAETGNAAAGTIAPIGSKVSPAGFKGNAGSSGATGGGVTVATKGDIQTYAGAPANLPVGTDGQQVTADSTAGTGLRWQQTIPNAASSADDNKIAVANAPAGTEKPAPLQFILAKVTDTGAYQTVGGNARGVDAVDMQPARVANAQVASGNNSTIGGGRNNTSSGQGSVVGGGEGNVSSGQDAVVAGGANNTASGQDSAVCAGNSNTANAAFSFVAAGTTNIASGVSSAVLSGGNNTASGQGSVVFGEFNLATATDASVLGGLSNTASDTGATTIGGLQAKAYLFGQVAHGSGQFASQGDAQTSELIWKGSTTDATPTELFIGPASQRAVVPSNTTWAFHIIGVARKDDGTSITFEVKGGIKNTGGTVVLVAAVTAAVIADGTGAAMTIANFTVSADDPNNSLKILVTGIALQNWRWVAHARLVEVSH